VLESTKTRAVLKNYTRCRVCAMLVTHMSYIAVQFVEFVGLCALAPTYCVCLKYSCVSSWALLCSASTRASSVWLLLTRSDTHSQAGLCP